MINRAALRREIDSRDGELDEIERLKAAFKAAAEKLAREHSGLPEDGPHGWRATVNGYIDDFLSDLFCERERQLEADNEDDLFRIGERP